MKKIKNILLGITALASVTACTDNDRADYTVDKPESIAIREVLNQYDALKTYIDKEQNPIFKIGAGIDYTTYTDKGVLYRMLNTNFDELSLIGNQMQHGSLISNDGSLDTLTLTSLFEVAKDAGVSVFGHTLCGSENQNSAYLNNIIVPSTIEAEGNLLNVADLKKGAFTGWSNAGDFVVTSTGGVRDEGIVFSSSTNTPWELTLASPSISIDPTKDYYLSFYVKPSAVGKIRIYFDKTTFNYPSAGLKDLPEAGTWQRVYYQIPGFKAGTETFQFFIDFGYVSAVNYAIDITSFTLKEGIVDPNDRSQLIERTDEEKTEVINDALDSYISGMMKMCTPAVNSWTVVNEPMDDANPSMIKTGEGKTLGSGEFYWQDYIGEYYAAKAIELARKYYAENGGSASDLNLFINESNLLDNSAKCAGLINYIKKIETDKGVKVDGIATELKVVCGVTPIESVKTLFSTLAATGKQVKISKFELAYRAKDAAENSKGASLTVEQQMELSDFYQDVLLAYFDIVPANQRAGITYWSYIDRQDTDGVGLWSYPSETAVRNFTYEGFVKGLSGGN